MSDRRGLPRSVRLLWGLVAAALALGWVGYVAPAVSAETVVRRIGTLEVTLPEGANPTAKANQTLMPDPGIRRAYQVVHMKNGATIVRAWDLDSRTVVQETELPRSLFPTGPVGTFGSDWVHTVDYENHVLYLGYRSGGQFGGVAGIDGRTLEILSSIPQQIVHVNTDPDNLGCTSRSCLPQTPTVSPTLVGLAYVPSDLTGLPPKLLLYLQEIRIFGTERNFATQWVAQWDIAAGRQDWIYRVQACGNSQLPDQESQYQAGIFQARLGAAIYMGCIASGGTGQVVRLLVDAANSPTAEQAYPGPLNTFDMIPDPQVDHMLLRVRTSEGDSWWVFDGSSSSYTGVISFTVSPLSTAAGVDPLTGRFYVLSAPSTSEFQRNAGGLQMSDSRRAPAPQPLQFPEFARDGEGTIVVDVHPDTGERTVYAKPSGSTAYLVFEDAVPLGVDQTFAGGEGLTEDVEEEEGVTGRNYTGTGRAYGLRVLIAGGLEGVPPTGPNFGYRIGRHGPKWLGSPCGKPDREAVVGFARETGLANNLANASAIAVESDPGTKTDLEEPAARCYPRPAPRDQDVWNQVGPRLPGSPTYPRPLDLRVSEDEEDPRSDVDQLLGTSWPFRPVECTGQDEDASEVSLHPLDRGDFGTGVISDEAREQQFSSESVRASVDCNQETARVTSYGGLRSAEEEQGDAPAFSTTEIADLGVITVGQVDSLVGLFLDEERGLVARSIAVARNIEIGPDVSIDAAYTIAEAWAKGRPGTASTTFTRRICGVRVNDQLQDHTVYAPNASVDPNIDQGAFDPNNPQPDVWAAEIQRFLADPRTGFQFDPEGGGEVDKNVDRVICGDPEIPRVGTPIPGAPAVQAEAPVIDTLNQALGSRARITLPEPDPRLRQGSLDGYLASIQKDRLEQLSAAAVNNDSSTQVPAFELIVFNDDPVEGRGRQLYQFAGVDASVTYGIYLLNPFEDDLDDLPDTLIDVTGGVPPGPVDVPDPTSGSGPQGPGTEARRGPVTVIYSALGVLFRSPRDAALAAAIWALLFAPVQLSARRRALRALRWST